MSATPAAGVIWHDLECGRYRQDLALWLGLAARHGGPVLDVGAGTGRVSLALARAGHRVLALDQDGVLLQELSKRAAGLPVRTIEADARAFSIAERFPLIIAPMQTLQLLGGSAQRQRFFACAREHLAASGVVAVAISDTEDFEEFEWHEGDGSPLPDVTEIGGCVYSSQPTAVRREGQTFVLERVRSVVGESGELDCEPDRIALDVLPGSQAELDAVAAALRIIERRTVPASGEHIASQVVIASV